MLGSTSNPTSATPLEASDPSTNGTGEHEHAQEVHVHISPANGLPHTKKTVVVHLHTDEPGQQGNSGDGHDSPANELPVVVHLHTDDQGQQANRGEGHDLPTPASDITQAPAPAVVQHHHHHHWDTGNACEFPMPGESAAPGPAAGQQQQSGPQGTSGQEKEASGTTGVPTAIVQPTKAMAGEDIVGVVERSITPPVPGEAILFVHPVNGYSSMG